MIHDQDRSGWIGASDTARVMGKWSGPTFEKWWAEKLGLRQNRVKTLAMETGTRFEGKILDAIGVKKRDRQIRIPELRLRVNLDGESSIIHEVKTHKCPEFVLSRPYWMQAQAEMFAAEKMLEIVSYRLEPEDYENWLRPIDPMRIRRWPVDYDAKWVTERYLPRLTALAGALKNGAWPDGAGI